MSIPNFQVMLLPVLEALADKQVRYWRELAEPVAAALDLTDEDRTERLPSGHDRFMDRVHWAVSHLFQAELVARPDRGHVQITARGLDLLAETPDYIGKEVLRRYPEYLDWIDRSRRGNVRNGGPSEPQDVSDLTPIEAIEVAVRESNEALAAELLQRVLDQPPVFLEQLVLTLLSAMGYGGRAGASTEHLGRSGDGGIDGVVRQDVLGLDRVYVQAKRYAAENTVGRPDIQAFVGALHGQQADRGVFITTSRFSADARSFVERIPNRIVLIDGRRLVELMILHNVGVQDESTFVLKRLDEDFFDQ